MTRRCPRFYEWLAQIVLFCLVLGPLSAPAQVAVAAPAGSQAEPPDGGASMLAFSISSGDDVPLSSDRAGVGPGVYTPEDVDLSVDRPDVPLMPVLIGPSTWPTLSCAECDPDTDAFPMAVVRTGSDYCALWVWSNLGGILGSDDKSTIGLRAGFCSGYQYGVGTFVVDFGKVFTDSGFSHSLLGNVYVEDTGSLYEVKWHTSLDGQTWDWNSKNLYGGQHGGWLEYGVTKGDFEGFNDTDVPPFRYVKIDVTGVGVELAVHTYYFGTLRISGGGTDVVEGLNEDRDQCYTNSCPVVNKCPKNEAGGPVNTLTGHYYYQRTDLSIPSVGDPLRLERTYIAHTTGAITTAAVYSMPLGYGWTHSYNAALVLSGTVGGETDTAIYQAPGGSRLRFADNGDGTYTPHTGIVGTLTRTVSAPYTYTLTAPGQQVYTFDSAGKLAAQQDARGNRTQLSYDGSGRLDRVTEPLGERYLDFTYDASDRLLRVTDPSSRTVVYGYNASHELVTVTDTMGYTWTYTYTGTHLLSGVYDPDGHPVEEQAYDAQARVVTQTDALGSDLTIGYGNSGERAVTDRSGRQTIDHYSPQGALVSQVDGAGSAPYYTYDDSYNLTSTVDALGSVTSLAWSTCGCAVETITDALGYTTTLTYDARNNPASVTDARGNSTSYEYGSYNTPLVITDALGNRTTYAYNANGQAISTTDALGHSTQYGYDTYGQRVAITDALSTVTTYGYDTVGRLVTSTVAAGTSLERVTVNAYDDGDRLLEVTENYVAGQSQNYQERYNLVTRYGYDKVGRRIWVTDTLGHVTRSEYDAAGRPVTVTVNYTTAGSGQQNYLDQYNVLTLYGYDGAGRRVWVTGTLGHATRTWYDEVGRVISVTVNYTTTAGADSTQYNLITTYGYDEVGNRTWVTARWISIRKA